MFLNLIKKFIWNIDIILLFVLLYSYFRKFSVTEFTLFMKLKIIVTNSKD